LIWLLLTTTALTPIRLMQPALAADVVVNAGSTAKISTPNGGNGVPVIDIAKPNASGVSHNQYDKFNVNSIGLVLNNANSITQSKLAGYLPANTNLGGGPMASLILNEVVAANRSVLNGFIEVNGQRADVVIANPYGITCNGCGFINTPRVTLSTGSPTLAGDGSLTSFNVAQGDILISGAGLNASNQDIMDLVARKISFDGPVNAKDMIAAAGPNVWGYSSRTVTGSATGSGAVPDYAIDSTLLGGMYANRIRLIATEAGVGVRMLGDAAATGQDFSLTSAGKITLTNNNISAGTNISVSSSTTGADALSASGTAMTAGGDVSLTNTSGGGATLSGGTVKAGGNLSVQQDALSDSASGAGGDLNKRSAIGSVTISATNAAVLNGVSYQAGTTLGTTTATISVDATGGATLGATGAITLTATGLDAAGSGTPARAMDLSGAGIKSNAGITLDAQQGGIRTAAGGGIEATAGNVAINAKTSIANAATIVADAGNITIRSNNAGGGNLGIVNSATLRANGTLDISGNGATPNDAVDVTNQSAGKLLGGTVSVKAASLDNAGGLQGSSGVAINITNALTNQSTGTLITSTVSQSGQTDQVIAGSISNGGVLQSANALTVTGTTAVSNSGKLLAVNALTVQGGSAGTKLAVTNSGSGIMQAGGVLSVTGQGGGNNMDLTVSGGTLLGDVATLTGQTITNSGTIQGTNGATLSAATALINQSGGVVILSTQASQDEAISAPTITNAGTLQSGGSLTVTGTTAVNNSGKLLAANALTVQGSSAGTKLTVTNSGSGVMQAVGVLSVTGQGGGNNMDLTVSGGTLLGNTATLSGQTITNAGTIQGTNGTTLSAATALTNQSGGVMILSTQASQDEAISAPTITNDGTLQSGGSLTVTGTAAVNNSGKLLAANALTVQGTSGTKLVVTNSGSGVMQAGSGLSVTGNGGGTNMDLTVSGGTLRGDTATLSGQTITNAGTIQGTNGTTLAATTLTNQSGGKMILSTGASQNETLTLTTLTNAGTLQSGGALTINSGTGGINNSGTLLAGSAMTIQGQSSSAYTLTNDGRIQGTTVSIDGGGGSHNVTLAGTVSSADIKATTGALILYGLGLTTAGGIEAATTLDVSGTSISLTGSSASLLAGTNGTVTSTGSISNAGMMFAGTNLGVTGTSITNSSTGGIAAGSALTLTANSGAISNSGALYSGSALTASATSDFTNAATGTVNSGGTIGITVPGTFTNNNTINAAGNITIGANAFRNEGSASGGGAGSVDASSSAVIPNWGNQTGQWPPSQLQVNSSSISVPATSYNDHNVTSSVDATAYNTAYINSFSGTAGKFDLLRESYTATAQYSGPVSVSVQRWASIISNGGTLNVWGTSGSGSGFTTGTNQAGLLSAGTVNLKGNGGGSTFTAGIATTMTINYTMGWDVLLAYYHQNLTDVMGAPKVFDCVGSDSSNCTLVRRGRRNAPMGAPFKAVAPMAARRASVPPT
jgi:filamentous hemagglutinin family protein